MSPRHADAQSVDAGIGETTMSDNNNGPSPSQQGQNDANRGSAPVSHTGFNSDAAYQNYINSYNWQKQQNENK
jgi:hypothetical protein